MKRPHSFKVAGAILLSCALLWLIASMIPSAPAAQFRQNRHEFIKLANDAVTSFQRSATPGTRLADSPLYESATVYDDFFSDAILVEFIIDDFYLPLVFISTDNPDDAYDVCSRGGIPIERIEANWYVCKRDWN